jgi:secondary thiamine-phosphate synthase enzyme
VRQHHATFTVSTRGPGLVEITAEVAGLVRETGIGEGLCTVLVQHTSASLVVQENADPSARRDLEAFLARLVPEGDPLYEHVAEGPDDMPAHVRSALTQTSLGLPVQGGVLRLGTWQGLFLWEHRRRPRRRRLAVHVLGT